MLSPRRSPLREHAVFRRAHQRWVAKAPHSLLQNLTCTEASVVRRCHGWQRPLEPLSPPTADPSFSANHASALDCRAGGRRESSRNAPCEGQPTGGYKPLAPLDTGSDVAPSLGWQTVRVLCNSVRRAPILVTHRA
uniref:Uncharacterized protein n=1 Tax=Noctiluca scintillans TaxID=2966 RepID=A0A7S1AXH0_NOCSC